MPARGPGANVGAMTRKAPIVAVVDDEEDVRHALHRLLRSAGFEVLVYASGNDFLRHAAASVPDCVVLDLHMPGQSGFDVQAAITDQKLAIPVVVLTGNDMPETARARSPAVPTPTCPSRWTTNR